MNTLLNEIDHSNIYEIIYELLTCKGTVYFIGNGASASMASHFSVDLMKNGKIKTQCFHDPTFLTCYGNDYGYENIFAQRIEELGTHDDILFAISSSGNSENIIRAVNKAGSIGMKTIGFSGFDENNRLNNLADLSVFINGKTYGQVEISHNVILHYLIDIVENERKFYSLKNNQYYCTSEGVNA
jgi:D-sedoheptulose 7-phosphate isomerase